MEIFTVRNDWKLWQQRTLRRIDLDKSTPSAVGDIKTSTHRAAMQPVRHTTWNRDGKQILPHHSSRASVTTSTEISGSNPQKEPEPSNNSRNDLKWKIVYNLHKNNNFSTENLWVQTSKIYSMFTHWHFFQNAEVFFRNYHSKSFRIVVSFTATRIASNIDPSWREWHGACLEAGARKTSIGFKKSVAYYKSKIPNISRVREKNFNCFGMTGELCLDLLTFGFLFH